MFGLEIDTYCTVNKNQDVSNCEPLFREEKQIIEKISDIDTFILV